MSKLTVSDVLGMIGEGGYEPCAYDEAPARTLGVVVRRAGVVTVNTDIETDIDAVQYTYHRTARQALRACLAGIAEDSSSPDEAKALIGEFQTAHRTNYLHEAMIETPTGYVTLTTVLLRDVVDGRDDTSTPEAITSARLQRDYDAREQAWRERRLAQVRAEDPAHR